MNTIQQYPRVFISHSHQDKPFVERLLKDLLDANLNVWLDKQELAPGDSVIEKVSHGLRNSDYLVAVLSRSSIKSKWVQAELNAVLSNQLSGKSGTAILPVLIDDVDIPILLRDILYADFRDDYKQGVSSLIKAFRQEDPVTLLKLKTTPTPLVSTQSPCLAALDSLTKADLRR